MGTKNYAVVMPYTNVEATLNVLVAAGFGVAGERCTTISTGLCWRLKITVKERISKLIQAIVDSGAKLVLDGRQVAVPKLLSSLLNICG
uniref:Aldehyde dehydrogenase n=1 Tax=Solanum tuberosum TaxID=4113 RepID=M1AQ23_SOLTU